MKTLLLHGNLIDVEHGGRLLTDKNLLLDGETIAEIGVGEQTPADNIIDLNGSFVLPGLINLHVHLFGTGMPSKVLGGGNLQQFLMRVLRSPLGPKIMDKIIAGNVQTQLLSGVTTIRAVGDFCYSDIHIRDKIRAGKLIGPRMLVSGPAITVPGGHGDGTFAVTSADSAELVSFVDRNAQAGVDLIKICVTGGVMDAKEVGHPGELKMNLEQTKAVCDRAHALGLKVASHTESEEGLDIALRGGVDTIEHGAAISDEMLALYRENQSAMVVTFSPCVPLSILPPEITRLDDKATINTRVVGQGMADGANRALAEDIPLGLGTDAACPLCTQYNTWRELVYVSRFCGISPEKAICLATLGNAEIAGLDRETGSVTEGKAADLLIVRENPLEDLRALRKAEYVFAKGRQFKNPKPKKIEKIEQWLDSIDFEQLTFSDEKTGGNK